MNSSGYWQMFWRRRLSRRAALRAGVLGAAGVAMATALGCEEEEERAEASPTAQATVAGEEIPSGAKYGGRLVTVPLNTPVNFDAYTVVEPGSHSIIAPVYSNLLRWYEDEPGEQKMMPELAEAMPEQPEDIRYIYKLRGGVKYHDREPLNGRELTSQDVKYSFERITGTYAEREKSARALFRMRSWFDSIDKIETPDDYTATFTLKQPFAPFLAYTGHTWVSILPPELEGRFEREAIGTGPFMLDKYVPGDNGYARFRKHPNYFRKGRPFLDTLEFRFLPWGPGGATNPSLQADFLAGNVDVADLIDQPTREAVLAERPDAKEYRSPSWFTVQLYWNLARTDIPYADRRVRHAVQISIPFDKMIEMLSPEGGPPGAEQTGPIPPSVKEWALPPEDLPKYDLEEAKRLLQAAGVTPPVPMRLDVSDYFAGTQLATLAQIILPQDLWKIEINSYGTDVVRWMSDVYYAISGNYYGTIHTHWAYDDPDQNFYPYFHSRGSANNYHYSDPELDGLLEEQRRELNLEKREQLVREIQLRLLRENPSVYLIGVFIPSMTQPWVKNWRLMIRGNLNSMRQWDEVWMDPIPRT